MPKLGVNGVAMHYQQVGHQLDVVMIHRPLFEPCVWYLPCCPGWLPSSGSPCTTCAATGTATCHRAGYTLDDMTDDLDGLLLQLGIDRAHVVGHSFGGAVALNYASRHPERVQSVTLADARVPVLQPIGGLPSRRRLPRIVSEFRHVGIDVPQQVPRIAYGFLEEILRYDRETRPATEGPSTRPIPIAQSWLPSSRQSRRWMQLVRTTSAVSDLARPSSLTREVIRGLRRPVLAVFGQSSSCLPTLRGLQHLLPECRTVMVRGAGHFHPILRPEFLAQRIRHFILGVQG